MNDIFDSFFSEYPLFGRPTRLVFNTPVKDMMPSVYKKTDTGYKATIKTLGLDKVDITTFDSGIKVKGENEINGYKYNVDIELPIAEEISNTVLSIPMYYGMTEEEITYVIDKINEFDLNN